MKIDIQNYYEELLGNHWHRLYNLNELIATNTFSELRLYSIKLRKEELLKATSKKSAMELLFGDELTIPDWYYVGIKKSEELLFKVEL